MCTPLPAGRSRSGTAILSRPAVRGLQRWLAAGRTAETRFHEHRGAVALASPCSLLSGPRAGPLLLENRGQGIDNELPEQREPELGLRSLVAVANVSLAKD